MPPNLNMITLYDFLDDTCVFVTVAFLITRGSWLRFLEYPRPWRQTLLLGALSTLVGTFQIVVPQSRFPYGPSTLLVIFTTLVLGWEVGLFTGLGISVTGLLFHAPGALSRFPITLCSVLIAQVIRQHPKRTTVMVLLAGILAQSIALGFRTLFASLHLSEPFDLGKYLVTVPANAVGLYLLTLIVRDARRAADVERLTHEAEQARHLATEANLAALRARLNPHFLYNALSTIAALCRIAPRKAERAVIRLGTLLRKAIELNPNAPISLQEELEAARAYTEIEEYRFGDRLRFVWKIDELALGASVPALALVTLIENAVTHGIGGRPGIGTVTITIRGGRRTLVAVADDGVGLPLHSRPSLTSGATTPLHGLGMVARELRLLFGPQAQLRLFSPQGCGTLAVLVLPEMSY